MAFFISLSSQAQNYFGFAISTVQYKNLSLEDNKLLFASIDHVPEVNFTFAKTIGKERDKILSFQPGFSRHYTFYHHESGYIDIAEEMLELPLLFYVLWTNPENPVALLMGPGAYGQYIFSRESSGPDFNGLSRWRFGVISDVLLRFNLDSDKKKFIAVAGLRFKGDINLFLNDFYTSVSPIISGAGPYISFMRKI